LENILESRHMERKKKRLWENNIKLDLGESIRDDIGWIERIQDRC
jgi:hypothetical protein